MCCPFGFVCWLFVVSSCVVSVVGCVRWCLVLLCDVGCCMLLVVCCSLCGLRCWLLFVVCVVDCCVWLMVVRFCRVLFGSCCFLVVVRWWLCVMCCLLVDVDVGWVCWLLASFVVVCFVLVCVVCSMLLFDVYCVLLFVFFAFCL